MMNLWFKIGLFLLLTLFFNHGLSAQTDMVNKDEQIVLDEDGNEVQMFKTYEWLWSLVDPIKCDGETVSVHSIDKVIEPYVVIASTASRIMYDANGSIWCTDSDELDCASFYKLESASESWSCK